jgi:hypothetical protein
MSIYVHIEYNNQTYYLKASKDTTLKQLLAQTPIHQDIVVFSGSSCQPYKTPLVNLNKTLSDYNMWFLDGYVAEISVFNKTDDYDKNLYDMYLATGH